MRKLTDALRELRRLERVRYQVNLVALSKVPPAIRKLYYIKDVAVFVAPFVLIGVMARSWLLTLLLGGLTAAAAIRYWFDVETDIPAVIESMKMMRGESDDR